MSYRTRLPLTQVDPEALVVYCSAARYQSHFAEFLHEGLKLQNYSLVAIPGGVQVLLEAAKPDKLGWAGWSWIQFLVDADHPPRIILIGHEECRWYKHLDPSSTRDDITSDLKVGRDRVQERFPEVKVEMYYSHTGEEGRLLFDPV